MELNTSQPRHSQIISKPSRNPIVLMLLALTVLILGVVGVLLWQKAQEVTSIQSELHGVQQQLSTLLKKPAAGSDLQDESKLGRLVMMQHEAQASQSGAEATPYLITIKYLDSNNMFARVHVEYLQTGSDVPKNTLSGKYDYFICKKVTKDGASEWVVLAKNPKTVEEQDMLKQQYGVPADMLDLTKERPA